MKRAWPNTADVGRAPPELLLMLGRTANGLPLGGQLDWADEQQQQQQWERLKKASAKHTPRFG